MRITGGDARGLLLKVPSNANVRPTTDMARGSIFSMLASMTGEWSPRVLDLFAGSGALGIEALSRGAEWADFIDQNPRCCGIIKQNLTTTGFHENSHVYCSSVNKAISFLNGRYDLIFLDPPYADKTILDIITQISLSNFIKNGTVMVIPHTIRLTVENSYNGLHLIKQKKHGDTCISIFCKEAGA